MITQTNKAALLALVDSQINTNGNAAITGAIMNSFLHDFIDQIESEVVEQALAPTVEPLLRFWRSPEDFINYKDERLPSAPFVPIRREYTAKDYGVKGDGTDETTTIQSAIDYVSSQGLGVLKFDPGVYRCNVTLKPGVLISGYGVGITTFQPAVDSSVFVIPISQVVADAGLENFTINGNPSYVNSRGLYAPTPTVGTWLTRFRMSNVTIEYCGAEGVYLNASFANRIRDFYMERVVIVGCVGNGLKVEGGVNGLLCHSCSIEGNGTSGSNAKIMPGSGLTPVGLAFYQCQFPGSNTQAISVEITSAERVVFLACEFSECNKLVRIVGAGNTQIRFQYCVFKVSFNTTYYFHITSGKEITISHCLFKAEGAATVTNFIYCDGLMSGIPMFQIEECGYEGSFTNHSSIPQVQPIAAGAIRLYKFYLKVDTEGETSQDFLDNILDYTGDAKHRYQIGQIITLVPNDTNRTIFVRHATGNIKTPTGLVHKLVGPTAVVWDGAWWCLMDSSRPDAHYTYIQVTPSDTWVITHNLGKHPSVAVHDSAGTEVVGRIVRDEVDLNELTIIFTSSFAGRAYLN
ncbi:hypothetical protein UFOVP1492_112 [uncultured Caudovirales phage]|uniref:Pectate lyase superfamily protein n=1 Tax=uncultured Caudovirales phage TaxID=2100421 RepID=A0A6J7XSG7_9CAUD|nr:hypothetical protein UFOVP1127_22 [uncultured Caudovirales phage]CAB4193277.1 hypothetical protein UFOVP1242_52 [uncultured Caudovirales phage]CAB4217870.1 hypothetical protein UFOVP1492_112 [uncultured Caudovirales phage]CAB5230952.1 hypothetical protein UFOVP1580_5 [uncultured Caudovirales phage]